MTADPLQPLIDTLRSVWTQADVTSLAQVADQLLRTQSATLGTSTASLTFGQGNDFREAEIAEIRARIAQVMPTGGYITITAQAGEGKSSVIA
jgi:hypothetical protein